MEQLSRFADLDVVTGDAWPGIRYFCTTRQGGVSQAPWGSLNVGLHTGDDAQHVGENRRRLQPAAGPVIWLRQVHGADVADADRGGVLARSGEIVADGLVTARDDRVLAIMTADCLPVVLGSADGRVIGVAHAGWRGLAAGVLENTFRALQEKYSGQNRPQWRAWIGPGISQPYFEVGDDVRLAFVSADASTSAFFAGARQHGKWFADLPAIARHCLFKSGVQQVDVCGLCTYQRADLFYSYRREPVTGRLVTLAWRNPDP